MFDFIPAPIRKRIYQILAGTSAIVTAMLPMLVLTGVLTDSVSAQVATIVSGILSAAGFVLAQGNVTIPDDNTN